MILLHPSIIVTMDKHMSILKNNYLGIDTETGLIEYISDKKPDYFDELIELPNKIILPGFINSHTHVAMTLLRGLKDDANLQEWLMQYILPVEKKLKPSYVYHGALYGVAEMLKHGITCFLDMYYHEIEVAKAVADAGIRAMLTYGSADIFFKRDPEEEFKIAEKFRKEIEDLIIERKAHDKIFFAYGPHSTYGCSKELLELFRDASNERNMRIHIHLSETKDEVKMSKEKTGKTPVEYLADLGMLSPKVMAAHVVWVNDKEISLLSKNGVHVLHNPSSNMKLASGVCPVDKMFKARVNVSLATDGPASNNRLDLWKEMYIASLLQKCFELDPVALNAKEAMRMATINGARALGLGNKIGSIEIGKFGDFIVVDMEKALESTPRHNIYSMIVYSLDSRYIESVWIGGKKLYDAREGFYTIDIENLRNKVEDIRQKLLEEAGLAR